MSLLYRMLDTVLPERMISRLLGHMARTRWPKFILRPALRWYINHFGVDMEEAAWPLEAYHSFTHFFTRPLRPGLRPLDESPEAVVSPVDGKVYVHGTLEDGTLIHAKGKRYSAASLLGSKEEAERFVGGSFVTIYLSPRDYHRIHSPLSGTGTSFTYLPGKLLPVNPPSVAMFPRLFAENERLVTYIENEKAGTFAMVKVGATNVGRIVLSYRDYVTNRWDSPDVTHVELNPTVEFEKGSEVGMFEMGSTVILLFEPGVTLEGLEEEMPLQLGQRIGRLS